MYILGITMKPGIYCQKQGLKVVFLQNWSGPKMQSWYVQGDLSSFFFSPQFSFLNERLLSLLDEID